MTGWLGLFFSVAGALLLAVHIPLSPWGFVLYLVGNMFWCINAIYKKHTSLFIMNVIYTAINILAITQWLL